MKLDRSIICLTLCVIWICLAVRNGRGKWIGCHFALSTLHLPSHFNHPVDHLPSQLTKLIIDVRYAQFDAFCHPLDHLPPNLQHLKVSVGSDLMGLDHLPVHLTTLKLTFRVEGNFHLDHLPPDLQHLILHFHFGPITFCPQHLPTRLTHLSLFGPDEFINHFIDLDHLPVHLTYLELQEICPFSLDHLPSSLTILRLCTSFVGKLDHLPSSLRELSFSKSFNFDRWQSPLDHLPPCLVRLSMGPSFYPFPLDHLPGSLCWLKISPPCQLSRPSRNFLQHLPSSLSHLDLQQWIFYSDISDEDLPSRLISLHLPNCPTRGFTFLHPPENLRFLGMSRCPDSWRAPPRLEVLKLTDPDKYFTEIFEPDFFPSTFALLSLPWGTTFHSGDLISLPFEISFE